MCPVCQNEAFIMGSLGDLDWYRCRSCGVDFYRVSTAAKRYRLSQKLARKRADIRQGKGLDNAASV